MVFMLLGIMLRLATGINSLPRHRVRHRCLAVRADVTVASQMAKYLGKALNKTTSSVELAAQPSFEWNNKGSMVFIGDKNVSLNPQTNDKN